MRPILVMTSNSEKALPDAFLRRCVYYHIPFPSNDDLREIAAARIPALPKDCDLLGDVITLFAFVRSPRQRLRKNPGTAELLCFLLALRDDRGYGPADSLRATKDWLDTAQSTLFKTQEDQIAGRAVLAQFNWSKPAG